MSKTPGDAQPSTMKKVKIPHEAYLGVSVAKWDLEHIPDMKHQIHAMILDSHGLVDSTRTNNMMGTALAIIDGKPILHQEAQNEAGDAILRMRPVGHHFESDDGLDDAYVWSRRGLNALLVIRRRSKTRETDRIGLQAFAIKYGPEYFDAGQTNELKPEEVQRRGMKRRASEVFQQNTDETAHGASEDDTIVMASDGETVAMDPDGQDDAVSMPASVTFKEQKILYPSTSRKLRRYSLTSKSKGARMQRAALAADAIVSARTDFALKLVAVDEHPPNSAKSNKPEWGMVRVTQASKKAKVSAEADKGGTEDSQKLGEKAIAKQAVKAKLLELPDASDNEEDGEADQTCWKGQEWFSDATKDDMNGVAGWFARSHRLGAEAALSIVPLSSTTDEQTEQAIREKCKEMKLAPHLCETYLRTGSLPVSDEEMREGVPDVLSSLRKGQMTLNGRPSAKQKSLGAATSKPLFGKEITSLKTKEHADPALEQDLPKPATKKFAVTPLTAPIPPFEAPLESRLENPLLEQLSVQSHAQLEVASQPAGLQWLPPWVPPVEGAHDAPQRTTQGKKRAPGKSWTTSNSAAANENDDSVMQDPQGNDGVASPPSSREKQAPTNPHATIRSPPASVQDDFILSNPVTTTDRARALSEAWNGSERRYLLKVSRGKDVSAACAALNAFIAQANEAAERFGADPRPEKEIIECFEMLQLLRAEEDMMEE